MNEQENTIFGEWILAIGTVISAIANTPSTNLPYQLTADFKIIGNALQATGNAIQVNQLSLVDLNHIANEIQAIGNTTVIASLLLPLNQIGKTNLNINGNLLQALGGGISFAEDLQEEPKLPLLYNQIGNLLQVIGNSLQAISTRHQSHATTLNAIGNWIQATGAIMTAIGASTA